MGMEDALKGARESLIKYLEDYPTHTWLQSQTKRILLEKLKEQPDAYFIQDVMRPFVRRAQGWLLSKPTNLLFKEVGIVDRNYPRYLIRHPLAREGEEIVIWC